MLSFEPIAGFVCSPLMVTTEKTNDCSPWTSCSNQQKQKLFEVNLTCNLNFNPLNTQDTSDALIDQYLFSRVCWEIVHYRCEILNL